MGPQRPLPGISNVPGAREPLPLPLRYSPTPLDSEARLRTTLVLAKPSPAQLPTTTEPAQNTSFLSTLVGCCPSDVHLLFQCLLSNTKPLSAGILFDIIRLRHPSPSWRTRLFLRRNLLAGVSQSIVPTLLQRKCRLMVTLPLSVRMAMPISKMVSRLWTRTKSSSTRALEHADRVLLTFP